MRKAALMKGLGVTLSAFLAVTALPSGAVYAKENDTDNLNTGSDDGYSLVWEENFDGDSLNTDDWNVEQHEPGWVNAELQRYTSLDEGNIEVRDGSLFIKPHVSGGEETDTNEEETVYEEAEDTDISFVLNVGADKKESDTIALQVNFGKIDGY